MAWDQNAALHGPTPGVAAFEQVALRWSLDILGLPPSCAGAFVTGATQANLCGLAAARHAVLHQADHPLPAGGQRQHRRLRIVGGGDARIPRLSCRAGPAGWTSGPRSVRWAAAGVAEMIDGCCGHAQRFAAGLRAAGYEVLNDVLNDVVLNQVLVSFGSATRARRRRDAQPGRHGGHRGPG